MRSFRLLPLLLALNAGAARAQAAPSDSSVLSAVRAFDAAWNAKDTANVARWLAPEYRYFSSTGEVQSRARVLAFLASPQYRLEWAQRSALEPRIIGTTAVVSSRWQGRGVWEGGTFNDDQRCSLVLVKHDDAWRVVAEHCTQIRKES